MIRYSAARLKKRCTASIPRNRFARQNFSFGACRLSSGRPNPIRMLGIPRCSENRPTIGMEPPERM